MRINDLFVTNVERCKKWHPGGIEEWSPLEWAGAVFNRKSEEYGFPERELVDVVEERNALEAGQTASGLSPAQVERLALLAMAAGKLGAEVAKVVLYGWGSPSPTTGRPLYADVEHGMGRVMAAMETMMHVGDVRGGDVRAHAERARQRTGN